LAADALLESLTLMTVLAAARTATAAVAAAAAAAVAVPSSLSQSPFGGPLPASWGDLLMPTKIDVSLNYITGTLPESWSKLTTLKTL
jgi:hypothetical protein